MFAMTFGKLNLGDLKHLERIIAEAKAVSWTAPALTMRSLGKRAGQ